MAPRLRFATECGTPISQQNAWCLSEGGAGRGKVWVRHAAEHRMHAPERAPVLDGGRRCPRSGRTWGARRRRGAAGPRAIGAAARSCATAAAAAGAPSRPEGRAQTAERGVCRGCNRTLAKRRWRLRQRSVGSGVWGGRWGHSGKISGAGSVSATAEIAVFRLSFEDTVERIKGVALSVSAALSASPMVVIPWRICCQREGRDSSVVSLELHSSIDRFTSSNRECGFTIRLVLA